jgi:LPS sulfotransferase NodH
MKRAIQGRIFLVGCPRSGTTLLQCLLAANSHIESFVETHFFERLFSGRPLLSALGIASRRARPRLNQFLEEIGHPETQRQLPLFAVSVRQLSRAFVEILDTLTLDQGKAVWVEKTPGHLHFIDQIERLVEGAKFVHIVRNGADVVASLYDIRTRYPEMWVAEYIRSIDDCIQKWIEDTRVSMMYSTRENHFLVRYEQMVADPRPVLVGLCEFIGVPFEERMLTDYSAVAKQVILESEPWKASAGQPIQNPGSRKF